MKIQPYVERLGTSKEYESFQKKYNDAFLVAGFFVLDFETGANLNQIDYYIPSTKKVAAFTLGEKDVEMKIMDTLNDKIPERLDMRTNVDLDAIKGILEDEMKNRNMTEDIKKIIAVIQNLEGKKTWILNCVLSGMEILKAHIEDESKTVLKMEKASVLEYIKKLPPSELPKPDKKEIDDQIKELEKVKKALEEENDKLDDVRKHNALTREKKDSSKGLNRR
jgi:DNA repair exonuclease SbcCD ATPase subunit